MATGEDIIAIAAREIGYREGKDKHNKYGEWYGLDGVAWCMEYVQWVYAHAGCVGDIIGRTRKEGGTASCGELLRWYRANEPDCITDKPVAGCIVIFDFPKTAYDTDHTGIFVDKSDTYITTIDGNTSNVSGGDSNGGWVQERTRKLSYANPTYIIPRELEEDMDINALIRDITPEQVYQLASKLYDADLYKLYSRLEGYMDTQPLPTSWDARRELDEAIAMGITDGSRPMVPAKRYETAIMCKRSMSKRAVEKK